MNPADYVPENLTETMDVYVGNMAFAAALIAAALYDLRTLEIPNWLSLLLVLAFVVAGLAGAPPVVGRLAGLGLGLSTGVAVLIGGVVLFRLGLLGGGDVKLLAAAAPWYGWAGVGQFLLVVALCGGLLALLLLLLRPLTGLWRGTWLGTWAGLRGEKGEIPYGLAICAGGLWQWHHLLPGLAVAPS